MLYLYAKNTFSDLDQASLDLGLSGTKANHLMLEMIQAQQNEKQREVLRYYNAWLEIVKKHQGIANPQARLFMSGYKQVAEICLMAEASEEFDFDEALRMVRLVEQDQKDLDDDCEIDWAGEEAKRSLGVMRESLLKKRGILWNYGPEVGRKKIAEMEKEDSES